MKTYLMNTAIVPNFGTYELSPLDEITAKQLLEKGFTSAIGHESTARVINKLLGVKVEVNRITVQFAPGDQAVVFKLNKRPPEGAILDEAQLRAIGFTFALLKRIK